MRVGGGWVVVKGGGRGVVGVGVGVGEEEGRGGEVDVGGIVGCGICFVELNI